MSGSACITPIMSLLTLYFLISNPYHDDKADLKASSIIHKLP